MDTAIIVGVIIGSVVALVLAFVKTVLGVAWTGKSARRVGISETSNQNVVTQEYLANSNITRDSDVNLTGIHERTPRLRSTVNKIPIQEHMRRKDDTEERAILKHEEKSQNLVKIEIDSNAQDKRTSESQIHTFRQNSDLNALVNKRVRTCDSIEVGHIVTIDKQSMKIKGLADQEYVIPTYYIREYDAKNLILDVSIRYLYRYQTEGKLAPTIYGEGGQVLAFEINLNPIYNNSSNTISHFKESFNWHNLIQHRVKTSDFADIGHVFMIDEEFITILEGVKQEYVIPTDHFVKHDEENVFLDISKISLLSYKVKRFM